MTVRSLITSTTVVAAAATMALLGSTAAAQAAQTPPGQTKDGHYSFAVIGDVPYGDAADRGLPGLVDQINADPALTSRSTSATSRTAPAAATTSTTR